MVPTSIYVLLLFSLLTASTPLDSLGYGLCSNSSLCQKGIYLAFSFSFSFRYFLISYSLNESTVRTKFNMANCPFLHILPLSLMPLIFYFPIIMLAILACKITYLLILIDNAFCLYFSPRVEAVKKRASPFHSLKCPQHGEYIVGT